MILSEDWKTNGLGRKSPGYDQSREHIRLVEEEGYQLMTFPMKYSEEKAGDDGAVTAKIKGFTPQLRKRSLSRVGDTWYAGDFDTIVPLAEELLPSLKYPEGARFQVSINAYERSAKARSACIAHHGLSCAACGFDFAGVYGSLGEGFIHVHHVKPIGTVGAEYEVDPVKDLVPVCPNCHAMIHRTEPPLLVAQLAEHLRAGLTKRKHAADGEIEESV